MRIGIQTWGSRGDIQPFLALADGLQRDGHEVTLVITSVDSTAEALGAVLPQVNIVPLASPVIGDPTTLQDIEASIFAESDPVRQTQSIIEQLFITAETSMFEAAKHLCENNDLVIGHFFHYPLNVAAEITACPYVSVVLVHSTLPSAYIPPAGVPNLGSLGNRLSWRLVRSVLNNKIKKYADRLRAVHHLAPAKDLLDDVWASRQLTLIAISPQICPPQRDWPQHYHVCGFFNPPATSADEILTDEFDSFLSQGEPPVYITFGSAMTGAKPMETLTLLHKAVEMAGVRAVIQTPHWQAHQSQSCKHLHFVGQAPHALVFSRCSAIIHHGGAGTSQSALLAGTPSVVVAHTSEQLFWGKELARLAVAPKPLQRKPLTAGKLAEAIRKVTECSEYKTNSVSISEQMRQESGVTTAVQLIRQAFPE